MIRAFILEDEPHGIINLKEQLSEYCPGVQVVGEAQNIYRAMQQLKDSETDFDVAFLDINLPDGQVFQLLNDLGPAIDFEVIFVTAYEKYAIQACKYASIGYILKPIDGEELREAVDRIRPTMTGSIRRRLEVFMESMARPSESQKMCVSGLDGTYFLHHNEIIRLEAEDNYTHIHLVDRERITASRTIKHYQDMLAHYDFYRAHKKHIINMNQIHKFVRGDGGYVVMVDGSQIEVSRRRRPGFLQRIRQLQGD